MIEDSEVPDAIVDFQHNQGVFDENLNRVLLSELG